MRSITPLLALVLCGSAAMAADTAPSTQPSMVTLHLKDASPQAVFAELGKQAECSFLTNPDDLWGRALPTISVDIEQQPYYSALREVCTKSKLYPLVVDLRRVTLSPNERAWLDGPTVVQGAFMVLALQVGRSTNVRFGAGEPKKHDMVIQFAVLPEPRLRAMKGSKWVRLEEAVDDKGNSLLPPSQPAQHLSSGGPFAWVVESKLRFPEDPGKRIARVRGSAKLAVLKTWETWEIDNVLAAPSASRTANKRTYTIAEVKKAPDRTPDQYVVKVVVSLPGGGQPDVEMTQQTMHPGCLRLMDEKGQPLAFRGWSRGEKPQLEYNFQFACAAEGAQPAAGTPAKLAWEMPTATEEVTIPFEFADLPMP